MAYGYRPNAIEFLHYQLGTCRPKVESESNYTHDGEDQSQIGLKAEQNKKLNFNYHIQFFVFSYCKEVCFILKQKTRDITIPIVILMSAIDNAVAPLKLIENRDWFLVVGIQIHGNPLYMWIVKKRKL